MLVAHTRRHYAALLRARGDDGDWEQAIDLLAQAATIYRRLDIGRLADEAEAVLRRSQDPTPDSSGVNAFVRTATGWQLAYGGRQATVVDVAGLAHIAAVLRADGRPVHALELVEGAAAGDQLATELRSRLEEVDAQAAAAAEPVAAALGRAEGDLLRADLADLGDPISTATQSSAAEAADRARRLVALRIRSAVDRVEGALPDLGRHLRRSVRTGTFCFYEPEGPERGEISR